MSRLSIVMSLLFIGCVQEHPWARGDAEAVILDWPAGETTLDIDLIVGIVPGIWPDEVVSNAVRLSTEPPVFIDYWDHPELVVSPNRMGAANLRGILEECVEDSVCATKIPVRLSTDTPPRLSRLTPTSS